MTTRQSTCSRVRATLPTAFRSKTGHRSLEAGDVCPRVGTFGKLKIGPSLCQTLQLHVVNATLDHHVHNNHAWKQHVESRLIRSIRSILDAGAIFKGGTWSKMTTRRMMRIQGNQDDCPVQVEQQYRRDNVSAFQEMVAFFPSKMVTCRSSPVRFVSGAHLKAKKWSKHWATPCRTSLSMANWNAIQDAHDFVVARNTTNPFRNSRLI
jgi:hypothetical protein